MDMKTKEVKGTARGWDGIESIEAFQESVKEEQINTAKKNIKERFKEIGIDESEIEWQK